MFASLLLALLIAAGLGISPENIDSNGQIYYLSPSMFPTAFLGDYYTVQFRVVGLDNPSFTFQTLPSWFTGSPNGTVQGLPQQEGSYPVTIIYQSNFHQSTKELIIRVVDSSTIDGSSFIGGRKLKIVNPSGLMTYVVGSFVNFRFSAENGKQPYMWTFTNLPAGLIADMRGTVNGSFIQTGYYTFSATVADSSGITTDSYITINVQPYSAITTNQSTLVEVPNRNTAIQYDLIKIEQAELQATKAVYSAISTVYQLQNQTTAKREIVTNTTMVLALAEQQEKQSKAKIQKANALKDLTEQIMEKANGVMKMVKNAVQLAMTNLKNIGKVAYESIDIATKAGNSFRKAQQALNISSFSFIRAQNQSMISALSVKQSLISNIDAYNTQNSTFNTYKLAKEMLQEQLDKKIKAELIVNMASNERSIANTVNDQAQAQLSMAHDKYLKGIAAFNASLAAASGVVKDRNQAERVLGVAKMNYQMAMNQLIVAQAKKEQADKATSIITMQSSTLPPATSNSTDSSIFQGCQQGAYPFISGSSFVRQANRYGFRTASGHSIVFGGCTSLQTGIALGDLIQFQGYLKKGLIQGLSIKKIKI